MGPMRVKEHPVWARVSAQGSENGPKSDLTIRPYKRQAEVTKLCGKAEDER